MFFLPNSHSRKDLTKINPKQNSPFNQQLTTTILSTLIHAWMQTPTTFLPYSLLSFCQNSNFTSQTNSLVQNKNSSPKTRSPSLPRLLFSLLSCPHVCFPHFPSSLHLIPFPCPLWMPCHIHPSSSTIATLFSSHPCVPKLLFSHLHDYVVFPNSFCFLQVAKRKKREKKGSLFIHSFMVKLPKS